MLTENVDEKCKVASKVGKISLEGEICDKFENGEKIPLVFFPGLCLVLMHYFENREAAPALES